MKLTKRILACALACVMALCILTACGGSSGSSSGGGSTSGTTADSIATDVNNKTDESIGGVAHSATLDEKAQKYAVARESGKDKEEACKIAGIDYSKYTGNGNEFAEYYGAPNVTKDSAADIIAQHISDHANDSEKITSFGYYYTNNTVYMVFSRA